MSAIDPLSELEGYLGDLPAAIDSRRLGDGLQRASTVLRTSERQVDRVVALLELAGEIGFGETKQQAEMVEEVRDAAYDAGDALERAETPLDLDKALACYERDFGNLLNNLDRNMGQHWRSVVARQFEPMIAIGSLLGRIDADSDLGPKLAACGSDARASADGPGGRALSDRARRLLGEREALQARRRVELGEGDVAMFVNALAEDRATLDMVTDEVSAWLEENHARNKLKVKPGV